MQLWLSKRGGRNQRIIPACTDASRRSEFPPCIELTASEYALLETLMLRADRVLTRRFLEKDLFGAKENMSNALDVHREPASKNWRRRLCLKVRGVRYVIDTVAIQKEAN